MSVRRDGARLVLEGPVTLATHRAVRDQVTALQTAGELRVDWSNVEAVDSSALALILHWRREAAQRSQHAVQDNLPAGVISLAELYGVKDLL